MTVLFVNVLLDPGHRPREFSQQQLDFPFLEHEVLRMEMFTYSHTVTSQDFAFPISFLIIDVNLNKTAKTKLSKGCDFTFCRCAPTAQLRFTDGI